MSGKQDFLTLSDLGADMLVALIERAVALKEARRRGQLARPLRDLALGMIFEKASTRTRVSFSVAMQEMGGYTVDLATGVTQIARGEPMRDTARVLGAYCHGLLIRTGAHERADELARWAPVPVINGLTDTHHPCQVAADLFTVKELRRDFRDLRYVWVGDGNNVAHSWIEAAGLLGLDLVVACPPGFEPLTGIVEAAQQRVAALGRGRVEIVHDPVTAVTGAHVVSTDVWTSMGQESEAEQRAGAFAGYCVDRQLLSHADRDALVLHCLPAHRGQEISEEVLEGPQSMVWRQAENRLHFQKALLEALMGGRPRPPGAGPSGSAP